MSLLWGRHSNFGRVEVSTRWMSWGTGVWSEDQGLQAGFSYRWKWFSALEGEEEQKMSCQWNWENLEVPLVAVIPCCCCDGTRACFMHLSRFHNPAAACEQYRWGDLLFQSISAFSFCFHLAQTSITSGCFEPGFPGLLLSVLQWQKSTAQDWRRVASSACSTLENTKYICWSDMKLL